MRLLRSGTGCDFRNWDQRRGAQYLGKKQWRDEILAAQVKDTVPILRRDSTNGNIYWLPESDAIVRYLLQNYG